MSVIKEFPPLVHARNVGTTWNLVVMITNVWDCYPYNVKSLILLGHVWGRFSEHLSTNQKHHSKRTKHSTATTFSTEHCSTNTLLRLASDYDHHPPKKFAAACSETPKRFHLRFSSGVQQYFSGSSEMQLKASLAYQKRLQSSCWGGWWSHWDVMIRKRVLVEQFSVENVLERNSFYLFFKQLFNFFFLFF